MLQVRTGDVTFSVYSSKAGKFASKDDQFNFRHLNVRLDTGIPEHAGGIFAEMAGAETMSTATREMLHKPRLFDRLMRLEKKEAQRAARRSHLAAHRDGERYPVVAGHYQTRRPAARRGKRECRYCRFPHAPQDYSSSIDERR